MTELLGAIEASGPAAALRLSFITYPLVNAAHILAVGMLLTAVLAMHWALFAPSRSLPEEMIARQFRPLAFFAFTLAIATGLALFSIRATDYATNPAFLTKLGLIVAAMVNFVLFQALAASGASDGARRVSASTSAIIWLAALVAGRFIGFV